MPRRFVSRLARGRRDWPQIEKRSWYRPLTVLPRTDNDDPGQPRDVSRMDDFEVIAERRRIVATLAALTDRYRDLNREISTRDSLKWMLAP